MKDTIKANSKYGYRVQYYNLKQEAFIYDGDRKLLTAKVKSYDDYIDECKNGNNECAVQYEVFTTEKGNQFIYWGDTETCEDFITKVTK